MSDMTNKAEDAYRVGFEAEERDDYDYAAAAEHFARAVELEPDNVEYLAAAARSALRFDRYDDAENLLNRALAIREKTHGIGHDLATEAVRELAGAYDYMGRYKAAEALYERYVKAREKALGPDHPGIADLLFSMGIRFQQDGKHKKALSPFERAHAIREKAFPIDHELLFEATRYLAFAHESVKQPEAAEALYKRYLEAREKAGKADHPDMVNILHDFAIFYQHHDQDRKAEAAALYRRMLSVWEQAGVIGDSQAVRILTDLTLCTEAADLAAVEARYKRHVEAREKDIGADHPKVAESLHCLADLYVKMGRHEKAEAVFKRMLAIKENALGANLDEIPGGGYDQVYAAVAYLAQFYREQDRIAEAVGLHERHLKLLEDILGPRHPRLADTLEDIAELCEATGRKNEPVATRERAREITDSTFKQTSMDGSKTMARSDWFRRTTWTEEDRADFFARLGRSRSTYNKAQYATIQAGHLAQIGSREATEAALELLDMVLREWPVDTELALVHGQRADCFWALGDRDGAVAAWREAMEAQRREPGWKSPAPLDFAWTVATAPLPDLYLEALDVLEEFENDPIFPIQIYRNAAARALIHEEGGDDEGAARFARLALKAVEKGESGIGGSLGAVRDPDEAVHARLVSLAASR